MNDMRGEMGVLGALRGLERVGRVVVVIWDEGAIELLWASSDA
jgi:hypothetical protein